MTTVVCNLTIYLILGSDYVAGLHFRMKKLDKCYIHLQYVLTFIPSGFCRETNSHRCGHLYQQHRPCVIHWYGELWLYLHRLPHLHTNTFVHCIIRHESCHSSCCIWRPRGPSQLFVLRQKPRKTGVDTLLVSLCPMNKLEFIKLVSLKLLLWKYSAIQLDSSLGLSRDEPHFIPVFFI